MSAERKRRAMRIALAAGPLAVIAMLDGCATVGSHVHGSFSCQAPDGICAPSSTIDDRALAIISGEADPVARPVAPSVSPMARAHPVRTTAAARGGMPAGDAQRTGEKVLRVVFQPYIDDSGRLHEASAVRAVVRGEWQTTAVAPPALRAVDPTARRASLADAVDRADLPVVGMGSDPDAPSPAAIAAARAKLDPVAAIKADVAARLERPAATPRRGKRRPVASVIVLRKAPARVTHAAPEVADASSVQRAAAGSKPAEVTPPTPVSARPEPGGQTIKGGRGVKPITPTPPPALLLKAAAGTAQGDLKLPGPVAAATGPVVPSVAPTRRAGSFPVVSPEDN